MKTLEVLIVSVMAVLVASDTPSVQDSTDCRKLMMVMAKKQLKVFGECSREMRAEIEDPAIYQQKIQCVVRCAMQKEKMLDENAQMSKASVQAFLDVNVPKIFHEIGHIFMDNCMAKFDGKFDTKDEYCKTYGDFIKCMQDKIGDVC